MALSRIRSIALAASLLAPCLPAWTQVTAQDESPVALSLSSAKGKPGDIVALEISVQTEKSLAMVSLALDFDETFLEVLGIDGALVNATPTGSDGTLAAISYSNVDAISGNQMSEGWAHYELKVADAAASALPVPQKAPVVLAKIRFLIRPTAKPGFTKVAFATVGPISTLPTTYYTNSVGVLSAPGNVVDISLPADSMAPGGIDIIGEVGFFMRGDTSWDRKRNIGDVVSTLSYLFIGNYTIPCMESADANDDTRVDVADPVFTLRRLFLEDIPFPAPDTWGPDPDPAHSLGCAAYPWM
jgi:hypothetical protein